MTDAPHRHIENVLGHRFRDLSLLKLALTHSSFANENDEPTACNERLEFLGDAVLELAVSTELFRRFPDAHEGQLTRLRSRLVKTPTLAALAKRMGLPALLFLGRGEESQGGRERSTLLADAVEALFGALYLDAGFEAVEAAAQRVYAEHWPDSAHIPKIKDFKTRLQETTQQRHKERPIYTQLGNAGPDHARVYQVRVTLPDGRAFDAKGGSLKKAEQNAAQRALNALDASEE